MSCIVYEKLGLDIQVITGGVASSSLPASPLQLTAQMATGFDTGSSPHPHQKYHPQHHYQQHLYIAESPVGLSYAAGHLTAPSIDCTPKRGGAVPNRGQSPGGVTPIEECTHTIEFCIPNECAGSVIGKAGQTLRELMQESGGRIQVERELDANGMRRVVIKHVNEYMALHTKALVVHRLPANTILMESHSGNSTDSAVTVSTGVGAAIEKVAAVRGVGALSALAITAPSPSEDIE